MNFKDDYLELGTYEEERPFDLIAYGGSPTSVVGVFHGVDGEVVRYRGMWRIPCKSAFSTDATAMLPADEVRYFMIIHGKRDSDDIPEEAFGPDAPVGIEVEFRATGQD